MSDPNAPPLAGLKLLEFAGLGPAPHAVMLLGDLGAEVVRIERAGAFGVPNPVIERGRSSLTLDLTNDDDRALALLDRAREEAEARAERWFLAETIRLQAHADDMFADGKQAPTLLDESEALARAQGAGLLLPRIHASRELLTA